MMPKMNGFEVLDTFKKQGIVMPVLILSNLGQDVDKNRARELGANDFFLKSDTPVAEIIVRVKELLCSPGS